MPSVDWFGKNAPICKHRTTIFWVLSSIVILSPACLQLTKSTLMTNCLTGLTASPGLPRTGDHFLRLVCSRVWPRWMDVALFAKQWELVVRSFFAGGSSQPCTQATDNNYLIFELNFLIATFFHLLARRWLQRANNLWHQPQHVVCIFCILVLLSDSSWPLGAVLFAKSCW